MTPEEQELKLAKHNFELAVSHADSCFWKWRAAKADQIKASQAVLDAERKLARTQMKQPK